MKAYQGYVTACKDSLLLGDGQQVRSHPFETTAQVSDWTRAVIQGNITARRRIAAWGWVRVEHANPIMKVETQ